jgi:hypothetical protein
LESESNFKKGGDFSALLYCAEHHGITADRKTKITEVSTETAEKCTVVVKCNEKMVGFSVVSGFCF